MLILLQAVTALLVLLALLNAASSFWFALGPRLPRRRQAGKVQAGIGVALLALALVLRALPGLSTGPVGIAVSALCGSGACVLAVLALIAPRLFLSPAPLPAPETPDTPAE